MPKTPRDPLIDEQIQYYEARAEEYDDWWRRIGRYDAGPEFGGLWAQEIERARDWVDEQPPRGHVLEIAAGTGNWSSVIEATASELTVLDSSPAVLEVCATKLTRPSTKFIVADIFEWNVPREYDNVFFAFWLSHVTQSMWQPFWEQVERAVRPGGRFMLIDALDPLDASQQAPGAFQKLGRQDAVGDHSEIRIRSTADGRQFRVAKRYWTGPSLVAALSDLGWDVEFFQTEFAFLCASGTRRAA